MLRKLHPHNTLYNSPQIHKSASISSFPCGCRPRTFTWGWLPIYISSPLLTSPSHCSPDSNMMGSSVHLLLPSPSSLFGPMPLKTMVWSHGHIKTEKNGHVPIAAIKTASLTTTLVHPSMTVHNTLSHLIAENIYETPICSNFNNG